MSSKKVLIVIDEDINNRWSAVAKKIKISKSGMVEDFLKGVIPILEKSEPRDVFAHALQEIGMGINDIGSLFSEVKKK